MLTELAQDHRAPENSNPVCLSQAPSLVFVLLYLYCVSRASAVQGQGIIGAQKRLLSE